MDRIARALLVVPLALAACGGATNASPHPSSNPSSGDAVWTELRLVWDFGPCPDDGKSCHQTLVVHPDGGFVAVETPNAPGGGAAMPTRTFASLESDEARELDRLMTPELVAKIGSLDCAPEYDATLRLEVDGAFGTRKQEIGGCVHASESKPDPVRTLVGLLDHHRFATQNLKADHLPIPTQPGDPCNVSAGCSSGLVCIPAPCVVAPCVSGSCQTSVP